MLQRTIKNKNSDHNQQDCRNLNTPIALSFLLIYFLFIWKGLVENSWEEEVTQQWVGSWSLKCNKITEQSKITANEIFGSLRDCGDFWGYGCWKSEEYEMNSLGIWVEKNKDKKKEKGEGKAWSF